jgi:hypothetical protein
LSILLALSVSDLSNLPHALFSKYLLSNRNSLYSLAGAVEGIELL